MKSLAGSRAEFVLELEPLRSITFGGDAGASEIVVEACLRGSTTVASEFEDAAVGFRYVLVPRLTPLPEPTRDAARARARVAAAQEAERRGELLEAYRLLTEAIDAAPLDAPVWNARGTLRMRRGDTWGAIWDLTRAIDLAPAAAAPWINRATARMEQLELAEAVADLDRALELQPAASFAWADRARCRASLGDLAGAIGDLEEALRRGPSAEQERTWRAQLAECRERAARGLPRPADGAPARALAGR